MTYIVFPLKPNALLICDRPMDMAAPVVKPDMTGCEIKLMKLPRFRMPGKGRGERGEGRGDEEGAEGGVAFNMTACVLLPMTVIKMPTLNEACAAVSMAAVGFVAASGTNLDMSAPTMRETTATGPTASCIDEPKKMYVHDGKMAVYKPLTAGKFARPA